MFAASSGTFLQACQEIARSLKIPACDDPKIDPCELVSRWLKEEDHSWLMILDNADDASIFFPPTEPDAISTTTLNTKRPLVEYLPSILSAQKTLLITTRNGPLGQDLAGGELCIEATAFSLQEAKQLLRSKLEEAESSFDVSSTENPKCGERSIPTL